jgi:hypothetical protein
MSNNSQASLAFTDAWIANALSNAAFSNITAFVNSPNVNDVLTDASYNAADDAGKAKHNAEKALYDNAKSALDTINLLGPTSGGKLLLALDDGTVIYDSSKTNSALNFKNKTVNENHSGRPEILLANLSASGRGTARRFSSSSSSAFLYNAYRLGLTPSANVAILRVAVQEVV